jgi:hypothetical protein
VVAEAVRMHLFILRITVFLRRPAHCLAFLHAAHHAADRMQWPWKVGIREHT